MAQRDDIDWAIKVDGVTKTFKLPHQKQTSLKGIVLNSFKKKTYEVQRAVSNVDFEVKKGEFFGIVGRNGSGKSTLLKCMAGVYQPNKGKIKINGSLIPFIELGVGFNPELTGRDNVFLNGSLLGFSRKQIEDMYEDIVEFAELEQFMDQKLNNYSSGMQVRLAFSIAIRAQGDILLLDEVLAVGDTLFQQKCFNYFHQLKKSKKTVLLVSHDANALRQYCTNGVLLEGGQIIESGSIEKVLDTYTDIVSKREDELSSDQKTESNSRHGTGQVKVKDVFVLDEQSKSKKVFTDSDKFIHIQGVYEALDDVETPVYGITIKDTSGSAILSSNNLWKAQKSHSLSVGSVQKITWIVPNIFNTGQFYIQPAVADTYGKVVYDRVDDMIDFKVRKKINSSAIINPDHTIDIANIK